MKNINKTLYIVLFAVLFTVVAFSSFWHAVDFFKLANDEWMAAILAGAFEIGQAAVLFALLTSEKDRKKVMPWVLMTMFTLVQVLGNVYASYKHIILNNVENLRFFKEPVFVWTSLPDDQATVIITYLVGGILPISSLLLTSMLTSYLSVQNTQKSNLSNESSKNDLNTQNSIQGDINSNINTNSSDAEDIKQPNNESNSKANDVIKDTPPVDKTEKVETSTQMIIEPAESALTPVDNNSIDNNSIDNSIKPNDKQTHVVSL